MNAKGAVERARVKKAVKEEFKKQETKLRKEIEKELSSNYHLIWMLALRDEFGFSDSRMSRVYEKVLKICDDISEGYLKFKDIEQALKSELVLFMRDGEDE